MDDDSLDLGLMARIAARDTAAFEQLYRLLAGNVYRFLRLRLTDEADLQDILQDTFLAVWNDADRFERHSSAATWVFGIARHKLLDRWRKQRRREEKELPLTDDGDGMERDFAIQVIERMSWQKAIASLPIASRELVYLAFVERMPYPDIALLLGIPQGTVKSRVYHLKSRLRTLLQGEVSGE